MTDFTNLGVQSLDRDSFLALYQRILDQGIRRVFYSTRMDTFPSGTGISIPPRIDYCISGTKRMTFPCSGKVCEEVLTQGDIHFSPSYTWKLPQWDLLHQMSSITFEQDHIRFTYIDYNRQSDYFKSHGADIFYHTSQSLALPGRELLSCLSHLSEEHPTQENLRELLTVLLRLAVETLRQDRRQSITKSKHTYLVLDNFLRNNFLNPNLTRESLAKEYRLSPSHVSRLFAEFSNQSFSETLRNLRLDYAAHLLQHTDYSLDEITFACGYSSSTFLINAFRRHFGISPGRYRRHFAQLPAKHVPK